jgi:hypothetical protein
LPSIRFKIAAAPAAPLGGGALPGRLSFKPGFGFCQIVQRAGKPTSGTALRAGRHRARLAHQFKRGVAVSKGTAKKQQITHG